MHLELNEWEVGMCEKGAQEVVAATVHAWTREAPSGVVSQVKKSACPQVSHAHTSKSIN